MKEENTTQEKDPAGFGSVDLLDKHLEIVELLKSNSYPNVVFTIPTNKKELENQLCFHLIEEKQPFCVDTKSRTVSYQNKVESNIKAIFKI